MAALDGLPSAKRIVLWSDDDALAARIATHLVASEAMVRVGVGRGLSGWTGNSAPDLFVLDWRGRARQDLDSVLRQLQGTARDVPVCAVAHVDDTTRRVEALVYHGRAVAVSLVPDGEHVGLLIRAYLNNSPYGFAAVAAIGFILALLPSSDCEILNLTICSGFTASSVKECATTLMVDRGTLRRRLGGGAGDCAIASLTAMEAAQLGFARALLRSTRESL